MSKQTFGRQTLRASRKCAQLRRENRKEVERNVWLSQNLGQALAALKRMQGKAEAVEPAPLAEESQPEAS